MRIPSAICLRTIRRDDALEIATWRYPAPYNLYNPSRGSGDSAVAEMTEPENRYFAVSDDMGDLIAFRCFGPDARVQGGDYSDEAMDLGGGIRPDLMGAGLGRHVIAAAMNFAVVRFSPNKFRCTVAKFNQRALRVCDRLGYKRVGEFIRPSDKLGFMVLVQDAELKELSIPMEYVLQNHSSEPTLASGTSPAGQEPRHP